MVGQVEVFSSLTEPLGETPPHLSQPLQPLPYAISFLLLPVCTHGPQRPVSPSAGRRGFPKKTKARKRRGGGGEEREKEEEEEEEEEFNCLKGSSLGRACTGCCGLAGSRLGPWVLLTVLLCMLPT